MRADQPCKTKPGEVCIYYKEPQGIHIKDIPNLTESTLCQVTINKKNELCSCILPFSIAILGCFKKIFVKISPGDNN